MQKVLKYFRDDIHGDIKIVDQIIIDLINLPEFQRLRRIAQLGGAQYVFDGANHSRFSHSLGVYHIVFKFLENESILNHLSDEEKLDVKIAGLLHDIGHGPFSHSFESISVIAHEEYSIKIIEQSPGIVELFKKNGINAKNISDIIRGKHKNNIVNLLISSQLDADRLDYLLRDSQNAGVSYSKLDLDWIIRNASVKDNKIVFQLKSLYAIESYLLGRYHMYKQVYNHKFSQGFDETLHSWFLRLKDLFNSNYNFKSQIPVDFLSELLSGQIMSVEKYINLDDFTLLFIFKETLKEEDKILSDLSNRLINRKFLSYFNGLEVVKAKSVLKNKDLDEKYYLKKYKPKKFSLYMESEDKILILDEEKLIPINKLNSLLNVSVEKEENKNIYFFPKDIM